jgi:hypothetical protein
MQYKLGFDDFHSASGIASETCKVRNDGMGKQVLFRREEHQKSFDLLPERQKAYIAAYMKTGSPIAVAKEVGVSGSSRTISKTLAKIAKRMGLEGLRELGVNPKQQDSVTAVSLRNLVESQKYRCALTGDELTPKVAQLDHKKPLAKGGTNDIENLQWVTKQVNHAKGTISQDDFVAMCIRVARHHQSCKA